VEDDVDWGTERPVLARLLRNGKVAIDLVVVPGHMVYDPEKRRKVYTTNELMWVNYGDGVEVTVTLQKGGRVGTVLREKRDLINQVLGVPVALQLDPSGTVIIECNGA
jgi:hypothetical protein